MTSLRGIGGQIFGVALGIGAALGVGEIVGGTDRVALLGAGEAIAAPAKDGGKSAKVAMRYLSGVWDPIHFAPNIKSATNEQCLSCHQEILGEQVREASPAGLKASDALAWYQTLDTYEGRQATFHARHLTTPLAKQVMNLSCSFCHQGSDPREEAPGSSATTQAPGDFRLRKMVNPETSCLMCHGRFPVEYMEGLEGSWPELREALESEDAPNGCLSCHAEQFRTVRHQVNYLKADAIEKLSEKGSSDLCYGCHGGRAWYRTTYPYPRHPWPGMAQEAPDWAAARPTQSKPEHQVGVEGGGKAK